MAYTERYVTQGAGGGGVGSSGDPWTLAESLTQAVAGDRVNIQSDSSYSLGADTVSNAGTTVSLIAFRGYNSSIGDLEGQGRNSDGTLNTTNFPAITLTGVLALNSYVVLQNLNFTGALSSAILGNGSELHAVVISCSVTNTASNASTQAISMDNYDVFINCDFICTETSHRRVLEVDFLCVIHDCRIIGNAANIELLSFKGGTVVGCAFLGVSTSTGINVEETTALHLFANNTFYGLGTTIKFPNTASAQYMVLVNNHPTDNNVWLDNQYDVTADLAVIEVNNRTRDNTTPRIGIGNGVNAGEITTDTGGAATDYVDAPNGDITLIAAAPAVDTGLGM